MLHALKYATDGFAVFPVYEPIRDVSGYIRCSCEKIDCRGKHPRTIRGVLDASVNYAQIKEWWSKWPNASIGLATGRKSGLAVIDLDGLEGIASGRSLRLQSSVCALTGNGKQLFYADTDGKLKNSVKKIAPGIDTRGDNGYVVVPPSLHPNGKRYVWQGQPLSRKALSNFPVDFAAPHIGTGNRVPTVLLAGARKPEGWMAKELEAMKIGNIDNTLVSVLGRLRRDGFSADDALAFLRPHADRAGATPGHLEEKIAHIWKSYPANVQTGQTGKSEAISGFLKDTKEPAWVCKPIIAEDAIVFFVGLPKTLKTWLLVDLAVEYARGNGMWLGQFPVSSGKVLFIDQERAKNESQRRFKAVLAAKGLDPRSLDGTLSIKCGTTIKLDDEHSFEAFRTELLDMRPTLILIDSFATFHTKPEQDRTEIQKVLEKVKSLRSEIGCSIVFVHHENKRSYQDMEEGKLPTINSMSGSTAIPAAAESVVIVRKIEDGLSMVHHVASTVGEASKSFTVALQDLSDGGIVVKGTL